MYVLRTHEEVNLSEELDPHKEANRLLYVLRTRKKVNEHQEGN